MCCVSWRLAPITIYALGGLKTFSRLFGTFGIRLVATFSPSASCLFPWGEFWWRRKLRCFRGELSLLICGCCGWSANARLLNDYHFPSFTLCDNLVLFAYFELRFMSFLGMSLWLLCREIEMWCYFGFMWFFPVFFFLLA